MKETCSLEEWGKIADAAMRQDAGINNRYKTIFFRITKSTVLPAEVQSVKKTINMFEKRANFEETKMESHSIKSNFIIHFQFNLK